MHAQILGMTAGLGGGAPLGGKYEIRDENSNTLFRVHCAVREETEIELGARRYGGSVPVKVYFYDYNFYSTSHELLIHLRTETESRVSFHFSHSH